MTVDVIDEDVIADKLRLTQVLLNILGNGVKFNKTGGTISVKSEECEGSEFDVCLTLRLSGEKKVYEQIESLQGLRVLVADDDTDTCLSVSKMLKEIGMRSEWTVSGKEAVIRAKNAMELGDEFYAYIIAWLMPDMNGIETVRRIRRVIGDSHPIIILTAYDWSDVEEAREAGVTAFCEKPLFMLDLRGILTQPYQARRPKERRKPLPRQRILVVDSYTATKRIRALTLPRCRTIPIIAMTANAFVEDQEKAVEAGMNGYQAKPIQVSELLKTIESVL